MDQNLINYIKQCREQNLSDGDIKKALVGAGWREEDINEGFASFNAIGVPMPIVSNNTVNIGGKFASATQIFKEAWGIYKKRPFLFIGITIFPIIVISLIVALSAFGGFAGMALIMASFSLWKIIIFGLLGIILLFAVIVIQLWGQTSLIFAIKDNSEGIGFKESYKRGWHKINTYLGVVVPSGLIIIGGMMLFAVPGIIFAVWFTFAIYVAIDENLKGMKALLKSKEYVRGHWWGVLWRQIFIGLIMLIISCVVSLIFKQINNAIISAVANLVLTLVTGPLLAIYSFTVYRKLKELKGNSVLEPKKKTGTIISLIAFLGILLMIAGIIFGGMGLFKSLGGQGSSLVTAQSRARDSRRVSDLRQIGLALDMYYDKNNTYPVVGGCTSANWATMTRAIEDSKIMVAVPKDPLNSGSNVYVYASNGTNFVLSAPLESSNSTYFATDVDGIKMGCNCNDPVYCLQP